MARAAETHPHLRYGRFKERGITFHTLRHSAGTNLAVLGVGPDVRQGVMGHADISSTLLYTHLRPVHEIAAAELASTALRIEDLIVAPVGTSVPAASSTAPKLAAKPRYRRKAVAARKRA